MKTVYNIKTVDGGRYENIEAVDRKSWLGYDWLCFEIPGGLKRINPEDVISVTEIHRND